jgi:S1-C subfamily serine protease
VSLLDLAVVIILGLCTLVGYREGFIRSACSLLAGAGGLALAVAILHWQPNWVVGHPLLGRAVIIVVSVVLISAVIIPVSRRLERYRFGYEGLDRAAGAFMRLIFGLILVWALGAVMGAFTLNTNLQLEHHSAIVRALDRVVSPQPLTADIRHFQGRLLPELTVNVPIPDIATPSPISAERSGIDRARQSAVKVIGDACRYQLSGSGWLVTPNEVVTNEHVIAGTSVSEIEAPGEPADKGQVVYADPVNDIAIIRLTRALRAPALVLARGHSGEAAALLSYPDGNAFAITPVRLGSTEPARMASPDGHQHVRETTVIRGMIKAGDSGGPIINNQGQVVDMIFARSLGGSITGGFAIPAIVLQAALQAPKAPAGERVVTPCLS